MIEIITGAVFMSISAGLIYLVWTTNPALVPIIILCGFFGLGAYFVFGGIKKLLTNFITAILGKKTYGYVIDVYSNDPKIGEYSIVNVDIAVIDSYNSINIYTIVAGRDWNRYRVGEFVRVKQAGNNVKPLKKIYPDNLPNDIKNRLSSYAVTEKKKRGV